MKISLKLVNGDAFDMLYVFVDPKSFPRHTFDTKPYKWVYNDLIVLLDWKWCIEHFGASWYKT